MAVNDDKNTDLCQIGFQTFEHLIRGGADPIDVLAIAAMLAACAIGGSALKPEGEEEALDLFRKQTEDAICLYRDQIKRAVRMAHAQ